MSDTQSIDREELVKATRAYVLSEFLEGVDASELEDAMPLISGGILNSLATTRLVAHLEETYGIRIDAHEMSADHMDTISDIADLVAAKLKG